VSIKGGPHGPATARNRGVAASGGDLIVFVDSDVMLHADTLARIEEQFLAAPDLAALFGSYDATPTDPGVISGYRNLLHHFVHQQSERDASTFWAGCGAIRREAFAAADGFDETYRWASIEDIELGLRLRARGHRLLLCPEIQATHRKRWSFAQVVHTDVMRRTVPWTKLILRNRSLPNDLNLRFEHRLSAMATWLLLMLVVIGFARPLVWDATLVPIALLLICNWRLYRLFRARRGFFFSLGAIALHWLHYLYTSAAFVVVLLGSSIGALIFAREVPAAVAPQVLTAQE
jgi:GT2 family glycosyltransferase